MNRIFKAIFFAFIALVAIQQANAQGLCNRISEIKALPFKGEYVNDAAYNALIEAGELATPCLIAKVTDTAKMRDPRQAPTYSDVRVGDVAYFVLVRITKVGFMEMLPMRVQNKYQAEGVYAYFEFVERFQNRKWLQRKLNEWYGRKRSGLRGTAQPNNSFEPTPK